MKMKEIQIRSIDLNHIKQKHFGYYLTVRGKFEYISYD